MAKDKKGKLPKRIGAMKIPKQLRKGGDKLLAQAQTEEGRAAIIRGAATIAGVAASVAKAAATKRTAAAVPAASPVAAPAPAQAAAGEPEAKRPDALADAIGAGVDAVLGKLFARK